ncbi:MAG: helix-turn-helix transcriptional regulator [Oscillospiraceae bacterium]|nr:helix-turn-helix transcriptional regulator [Oscillospiraceae bacterium]
MADTKTAVRARILELCAQRKITVNRLATISGVTQSTLNNIVSGRNHSVTVSTVKKLCDGLDISLREFFDAPVFDDLEQEVR